MFQMWASFLSGVGGGHPMGGINFDGAVLKQIVGWGGGGALTLENPGPILHVAGVLDAPLILLF